MLMKKKLATGLTGTLSTIVSAMSFGISVEKPNVLIILVDDAGMGDYSCYNNPIVKTPNIDRLYSESIRMNDFHVSPMCTPTRGELLTGISAMKNGASVVHGSRMFLRTDFPTMGDLFGADGYRTGQFGKWHVGDNYPFRPQDRGFQDVLYFNCAFIGESDDTWCNDYYDPWLRRNDGVPVQLKGYSNDILFDEAMSWMKQCKDNNKPFLCYLPLNLIHTPLLVPERYIEPYKSQPEQIRKIYGMLANLDENMGKLDEFLQQSGLKENTILMFLNDNGGLIGVTVWNCGMRGKKMQLYDGGHRSPLFIRWPAGKLRPAGDLDGLSQVTDIVPTLMDLCDVNNKSKAVFDGENLAPVLRDAKKELPDRTIVVQYGGETQFRCATLWRKWRLVHNDANSPWELYDVSKDPAQENDLSASQPDIAKKLKSYYDEWWKDVLPWAKKRSAIIVGNDAENPLTLLPTGQYDATSMNSDNVRKNTYKIDRWFIHAEQPGNYEITLRRWPAEANAAIRDSVPAWNSIHGGFNLPEGPALPIAKAKLTVGNFEGTVPVDESDTGVTFKVKLDKGDTMLRASFQDDSGKDICLAYYVTVHRVK